MQALRSSVSGNQNPFFMMFIVFLSWQSHTASTPLKSLTATLIDALANSICHPRMLLSGIHDFGRLQAGFPLRITAGMTFCERILIEK